MTSYTVQFRSGTSCTVLDATSGAAALAIARYETGDKTSLVLTYRGGKNPSMTSYTHPHAGTFTASLIAADDPMSGKGHWVIVQSKPGHLSIAGYVTDTRTESYGVDPSPVTPADDHVNVFETYVPGRYVLEWLNTFHSLTGACAALAIRSMKGK